MDLLTDLWVIKFDRGFVCSKYKRRFTLGPDLTQEVFQKKKSLARGNGILSGVYWQDLFHFISDLEREKS